MICMAQKMEHQLQLETIEDAKAEVFAAVDKIVGVLIEQSHECDVQNLRDYVAEAIQENTFTCVEELEELTKGLE